MINADFDGADRAKITGELELSQQYKRIVPRAVIEDKLELDAPLLELAFQIAELAEQIRQGLLVEVDRHDEG